MRTPPTAAPSQAAALARYPWASAAAVVLLAAAMVSTTTLLAVAAAVRLQQQARQGAACQSVRSRAVAASCLGSLSAISLCTVRGVVQGDGTTRCMRLMGTLGWGLGTTSCSSGVGHMTASRDVAAGVSSASWLVAVVQPPRLAWWWGFSFVAVAALQLQL